MAEENKTTIKQLNIPNDLMKDIKIENLNRNEELNSNARRDDGETLEGTMLQLCADSIILRKAIRNNESKFAIKVLGKTFIVKSEK